MGDETFHETDSSVPLLADPVEPSTSPPAELLHVVPVQDPDVASKEPPPPERDVTATPPSQPPPSSSPPPPSSPPPKQPLSLPPPPPISAPPSTASDKGPSSADHASKMVVPFPPKTRTPVAAQDRVTAPRPLRLGNVDTKATETLAALTLLAERDLRGLETEYIAEEATNMWARMADESQIVTMAYQEAIKRMTAKSLANAPLVFVKDLRSKAATRFLGNSWDVCYGHRQTVGAIYRADLESIRWVLLATLRGHLGIDTQVVVEEAFYTYFIWPGMCYISVAVVNVSRLFSRNLNEIVDPKRGGTATTVSVMTGGGRTITIDPENLTKN